MSRAGPTPSIDRIVGYLVWLEGNHDDISDGNITRHTTQRKLVSLTYGMLLSMSDSNTKRSHTTHACVYMY